MQPDLQPLINCSDFWKLTDSSRVGLGGLCQHNLEHNRALQASSIMRA